MFSDSNSESLVTPTSDSQNKNNLETKKDEKTEFVKKKKKPYQKKRCILCRRAVMHIDYKNVDFLKLYLKKNNKIVSHKITGNCLKHQHQIQNSIKKARIMALLPFVGE